MNPHTYANIKQSASGARGMPWVQAVRAWVARLITINSWLGCCAARGDTGSRGHTQLALLPRLALSVPPFPAPSRVSFPFLLSSSSSSSSISFFDRLIGRA